MTRKTLLAATALAGLLAASPVLAQTAVTATADLNVRSGPGPNYPVVGVIDSGGATTITGCIENSQWCQVDVDGQQGWAYSDYLTADLSGETVVITQRRTEVGVPVVTYEESEEANAAGGLAGAATGAVAGAIIGGPVGAAIGGAAGLATGAAIDAPPETALTYVRSNQVEPVYLEGEAVVGATLPETVTLAPIPEYEYQYVYVNGQPVLVEPTSRRVVYVLRD